MAFMSPFNNLQVRIKNISKDTIKFLYNIRKYSSCVYQITSVQHSLISKILDRYIPKVIGTQIKIAQKRPSRACWKRYHKGRRHNLNNPLSTDNNSLKSLKTLLSKLNYSFWKVLHPFNREKTSINRAPWLLKTKTKPHWKGVTS